MNNIKLKNDERLLEAGTKAETLNKLFGIMELEHDDEKILILLDVVINYAQDIEVLAFDIINDPNDGDIRASELVRMSKKSGKSIDEIVEFTLRNEK